MNALLRTYEDILYRVVFSNFAHTNLRLYLIVVGEKKIEKSTITCGRCSYWPGVFTCVRYQQLLNNDHRHTRTNTLLLLLFILRWVAVYVSTHRVCGCVKWHCAMRMSNYSYHTTLFGIKNRGCATYCSVLVVLD